MKRVTIGMIGGGEGAFIGEVHRLAMRIDGRFDLVAGALSSDPDRSRRSGAALGLDPGRVYRSYLELLEAEAGRLNAVAVVTPNDSHFPICQAAANAGFSIMCDKPATATLREALDLRKTLARADVFYTLSYAYLGYPLVQEARARIAAGDIGAVRRVNVIYPQGWLAGPAEASGNKQAAWRTDPAQSGIGGAVSDIGTHAFNLAEFVTGLRVDTIAADLAAFGDGRRLDDDAAALMRFENGARGLLLASQICTGEENGLSIAVNGETGALKWRQEEPNTLEIRSLDGRIGILRGGSNAYGLSPAVAARFRTPTGHPEGYLGAFANIYAQFADQLLGDGSKNLPGIEDGVRGMAFVEAMVASSEADAAWVSIQKTIDEGDGP